MPTHRITYSYEAGGETVAGQATVTSDTELNQELALDESASNVLISTPFTVANLQSIMFHCTTAATVKVNSSSSPSDTISLSAGIPAIGSTAASAQALLSGTTTATAMYVSCVAGGTFKFKALLNNSTNLP